MRCRVLLLASTSSSSSAPRCARAAAWLLLAGIAVLVWPTDAWAGKVTRSCKGGWYIEFQRQGAKAEKLTGPLVHTGSSTSSGVVPSPAKARERACRQAAEKAAAVFSLEKARVEVCKARPDSEGWIQVVGGIGKSRDERRVHKISTSSTYFMCKNGAPYKPPVCGNAVREGSEECDDGERNSDSGADACRTNCRRPRCGDSVADSGEQCDEGRDNNAYKPGGCRLDCKVAHCGDGVLDPMNGEICDDGNNDSFDGCHQCQRCFVPKRGMTVANSMTLCVGDYVLSDKYSRGAIKITGDGVTLDCQGARVRGTGGKGIGIIATGNNVTLRNCRISGYSIGTDLRGKSPVVIDSRVCGNGKDFKSAHPVTAGRNTCRSTPAGWKEEGQDGCSAQCQ